MFLISLNRRGSGRAGQWRQALHARAAESLVSQQARALFWLAIGLSTCAVLAGASLAPSLVAISAGLGVQDALWPRLLVSLPALGVPLGAALYSRFGRPEMDRTVLIASLVAYAICGAIGVLFPAAPAMLILRLLQGVTIAPLMLIALRILFAGADPRGDMALQSTMMTAATVVVLLASGIAGAIDWHLPFALNLLPLLLIPAVQALVPAGQPAASPARAGDVTIPAAPEGTSGVFIAGLMLAFLAMAAFFAIPTQLPAALAAAGLGGSGLAAIGIMVSVVAASLSGIAVRRVGARATPAAILLLTWGLVMTGFFQLTNASGLALALSGAMLVGLGFGAIFPVLNHWAITGAFGIARARAMALMTAAFHLGQFSAPLLGAAALRQPGAWSVFVPYLVLATGALALVMAERRRIDRAAVLPAIDVASEQQADTSDNASQPAKKNLHPHDRAAA